MKPIRIPTLSPKQLHASERSYRTTRKARLRTRAQIDGPSGCRARSLTAQQRDRPEDRPCKRGDSKALAHKRYLLAERVEGFLRDVPHPGAPRKVTEE